MKTSPSPRTARALLFPEQPTGGSERLDEGLRARGVVSVDDPGIPPLAGSALGLVDEEIGRVAEGLLDVDLGDALVAGWQKYAALVEAGRRTLATPGSEEVVVLARHRVRSSYRPSVDLLVDGVKVNSFEFDLQVVFDLEGVSAVVSTGRLTALRGGRCEVRAALTLEGARLAERRHEVDLALIVPLSRPIPLVEGAQPVP